MDINLDTLVLTVSATDSAGALEDTIYLGDYTVVGEDVIGAPGLDLSIVLNPIATPLEINVALSTLVLTVSMSVSGQGSITPIQPGTCDMSIALSYLRAGASPPGVDNRVLGDIVLYTVNYWNTNYDWTNSPNPFCIAIIGEYLYGATTTNKVEYHNKLTGTLIGEFTVLGSLTVNGLCSDGTSLYMSCRSSGIGVHICKYSAAGVLLDDWQVSASYYDGIYGMRYLDGYLYRTYYQGSNYHVQKINATTHAVEWTYDAVSTSDRFYGVDAVGQYVYVSGIITPASYENIIVLDKDTGVYVRKLATAGASNIDNVQYIPEAESIFGQDVYIYKSARYIYINSDTTPPVQVVYMNSPYTGFNQPGYNGMLFEHPYLYITDCCTDAYISFYLSQEAEAIYCGMWQSLKEVRGDDTPIDNTPDDTDNLYALCANTTGYQVAKIDKATMAVVSYHRPFGMGRYGDMANTVIEYDGTYFYISNSEENYIKKLDSTFTWVDNLLSHTDFGYVYDMAIDDTYFYIFAQYAFWKIDRLYESIVKYAFADSSVVNGGSGCVDDTHIYTGQCAYSKVGGTVERWLKDCVTYVDEFGESAFVIRWPAGICNDGTYLYVADGTLEWIMKVDRSTLIPVQIYKGVGYGYGAGEFTNICSDGTYLYGIVDYIALCKVNCGDMTLVAQANLFELPVGSGYVDEGAGICVDDDYVYVSDNELYVINLYDKNTLSFVRSIDISDAYWVYGLAVDDNYLYLGSYEEWDSYPTGGVEYAVGKLDKLTGAFVAGTKYTDYGDALDGDYCTGMYLDSSTGLLYYQCGSYPFVCVIDTSDMSIIYKVDNGDSGTGVGEWNEPIGNPTVLNGYIYVTDNNWMSDWNAKISSVDAATGVPYQDSPLRYGSNLTWCDYPIGICCDDDYFYFTDTSNNCVIKVDKATMLGVAYYGNADGDYGTIDGELYYPYDACVDDDYLYVADYENGRVVKIDKTTMTFVANCADIFDSGAGDIISVTLGTVLPTYSPADADCLMDAVLITGTGTISEPTAPEWNMSNVLYDIFAKIKGEQH